MITWYMGLIEQWAIYLDQYLMQTKEVAWLINAKNCERVKIRVFRVNYSSITDITADKHVRLLVFREILLIIGVFCEIVLTTVRSITDITAYKRVRIGVRIGVFREIVLTTVLSLTLQQINAAESAWESAFFREIVLTTVLSQTLQQLNASESAWESAFFVSLC